MRASVLSKQVNCESVLRLLGCPPRSNALPAVTACPLCHAKQQLIVTNDAAINGHWSYCRSCKFAGDMITLASHTWKLGVKDTIAKLVQSHAIAQTDNLPVIVETYVSGFYEPLVMLRNFWQQCRTNHVEAASPRLRTLQMRLGVRDIPVDWNDRAGQFIGSSSREHVDATIQNRKYANWEKNSTAIRGFQSRTFTGGNWKELLVIPFWDMPGRISAFLLIGRDADPGKDYLYKSVIKEVTDGGLAMLPAITRGKHNMFGNKKFIFTNINLAIRMHAKHSREHQEPLPLAATWDDGVYVTRGIWNMFQAADLIFWGTDKLKTIRQAKLANGRVSTLEVTEPTLATNMHENAPHAWLAKMERKAIPWAAALYQQLDKLQDEQVIDAIEYLEINGRDLSMFIEGCPSHLRKRLRDLTATRIIESQIPFEGKRICERADGWYIERQNECICNAIIRIEQVATTLSGKSYYRGTIKFNGKTYPFSEKAERLDKGLFAWAYAYLRDTCHAGIMEYYPRWNSKAIHIATKLSNPKYIHGAEIIGWDPDNRRFNFPTFGIKAGGVLDSDFSCLFESVNVPAKDLLPPGMIPRAHIESLGQVNPETQIGWAVTACIVSNILARAVNRNQLPIILAGHGACGMGGSAAIRLGCVSLWDARRWIHIPDKLPEFNWSTGWPAVISTTLPVTKFKWLLQPQAEGFIFKMSDLEGLLVAMRGRVNMVKYARDLGTTQRLYDAMPLIIPNYIQDLYRRNIRLPDKQPDLAVDVLDDMADWFKQLGGNPKAVTAAAEILRTPSTPVAGYLSAIVFNLFSSGLLKVGKIGHDWGSNYPAVMQIDGERSGIWIDQTRFSYAVSKACGQTPDILLITESLHAQHLLLDEPVYNGERGWLVPEEWWNENFKNWRADVGL